MVKYENLDFAMIKEIFIRWHFEENKQHVEYAYSRIIGQKFLAASGSHNIEKSDLFPLFGENNEILGTQLFGSKKEDSHAIQIKNLV